MSSNTYQRYVIDHIQYIDKLFNCKRFIEKHRPMVRINKATGETVYPILKEVGPLLFAILRGKDGKEYLKITGSIHKYYNYLTTGKEVNYNDFTIIQIKEVLTA